MAKRGFPRLPGLSLWPSTEVALLTVCTAELTELRGNHPFSGIMGARDRCYVTLNLNLKKKEMGCRWAGGNTAARQKRCYACNRKPSPVAPEEMDSWGILVFTTVRTRHSSTYTAVLLQGMGTHTMEEDLGKQCFWGGVDKNYSVSVWGECR